MVVKWCVVALWVSMTACEGAGSTGADTDACVAGEGEMIAAPSASASVAAAGDVIAIVVPVGDATGLVHVQLQGESGSHGDGYAEPDGASEVEVEVQIDPATPAGTLRPFIQAYDCGSDSRTTQYIPDVTSGTYLEHRFDAGPDSTPTSWTTPTIDVQ
jgi:hypothetical protein